MLDLLRTIIISILNIIKSLYYDIDEIASHNIQKTVNVYNKVFTDVKVTITKVPKKLNIYLIEFQNNRCFLKIHVRYFSSSLETIIHYKILKIMTTASRYHQVNLS